jgi:hypothetical protein
MISKQCSHSPCGIEFNATVMAPQQQKHQKTYFETLD